VLRLHLSSLIGYELIKNIKRVEDKFYLRLGSFLLLLRKYFEYFTKNKKTLAFVSDLLYSIRCTIVVQWHFYAIF